MSSTTMHKHFLKKKIYKGGLSKILCIGAIPTQRVYRLSDTTLLSSFPNSLHKTCMMYRIVYTKLSYSLLSQYTTYMQSIRLVQVRGIDNFLEVGKTGQVKFLHYRAHFCMTTPLIIMFAKKAISSNVTFKQVIRTETFFPAYSY